MRPFAYHRPVSAADIPAGATLLAGGQSLLPRMKAREVAPGIVADVKALLPASIRIEGDRIVIGAGTTHADIASSPVLQDVLPGLAALAGEIGDPSVRHRGTLGGALVSDHPAGDWPAAALALDAILRTDRREVPFATFRREADRNPAELVLEIAFAQAEDCAYAKVLHPAQRYALVGVFVGVRNGTTSAAITGLWVDGAALWDVESGLSERSGEMRSDGFADAACRIALADELYRIATSRMGNEGARITVIVHGSELLDAYYSRPVRPMSLSTL